MIGRRIVYGISLVIVLAAGAVVPMPLIEYSPGSATPVDELIAVAEATGPVNGDLDLLTVYVKPPSILETVRAYVSDVRSLRPRTQVIPSTIDRRTYFDLQEAEFRRSFRVAVAVGARAAGYDVEVVTAAQVAGILPGSPADGHLQVGDVITAINDTAVASAQALIEYTRGSAVGDEFVLAVERGEDRLDVTVVAGQVQGLSHPGIGVAIETVESDIDLPVDVTLIDQRDIGGPSAGLMVALTVYDLLAEEDLAAGRVVAGTGTIQGDGSVGRIGAIEEKVATAIGAGADIMLVPTSQLTEARAVAGDRLRIVPVSSFAEALAALRGA